MTRRFPCRLMSTASPKSRGQQTMDMLSENKDGAAAGANLAVICLAVCGGVYFCGQTIGEFNSNRSAMAVMKEELKYGQKDLKNETEQRLKDQLIADEKFKNGTEQRLKDQLIADEKLKLIEEKLKNETEQRLKDQLMTDLKLKLSEEKLKNAEERLKKGNLW